MTPSSLSDSTSLKAAALSFFVPTFAVALTTPWSRVRMEATPALWARSVRVVVAAALAVPTDACNPWAGRIRYRVGRAMAEVPIEVMGDIVLLTTAIARDNVIGSHSGQATGRF